MKKLKVIIRISTYFFYGLLMLGFVACEPAQKSQDKTEFPPSYQSEPIQNEKRLPKKFSVDIKEMKFEPADVIVQSGDTILFSNNDFVSHDVTEKNQEWTSGELKPGDHFEKVATKSEEYFCSIHVIMKGKITVK